MPAVPAEPTNALGVASFRYLWINSLTFYMVANALRFVYGWIALEGLDANESIQGLMVFLLGLPGIFLLLPAGVWADRMNRRNLLVGSQLATAVVMVITAVAIGGGALSLGLVMGSALLAGVTTAIGSPVRSSLIPELLPANLLYSGIALNALALTSSLIVGAVTAQIIGNIFDFDGVFWYLAILLIVGAFPVTRLSGARREPGESGRVTMGEAVREGLSFVFHHRALRTLFGLLALAGFVMNALMFVTLQAVVKEELGRDAGDAAPLLAIMGVGLAISSVGVMRSGNMRNKGTFFMRAMMVGTACLFLMGRATAYWQLMVLALIMGCAGGIFINMNQGLIQSNTPGDLMGRVMGLFTLVQGGLTPLGALTMGLIAAAIGPGLTMSIAAAFAFFVVVYTYFTSPELRILGNAQVDAEAAESASDSDQAGDVPNTSGNRSSSDG